MWINKAKLNALIDAKVKAAFDAMPKTERRITPPVGFNPLPAIMNATTEWLMIPWGPKNEFVEVKYNSLAGLLQFDEKGGVINVSQLFVNEYKADSMSRADFVQLMNIQENIAKATLNNPTYEQFEAEFLKHDNTLKGIRAEIKELGAKLEKAPPSDSRAALRAKLDNLELLAGYILPHNTMAFLTKVALGIDVTDTRKLTKQIVHDAYERVLQYGGKVTEYIPAGVYTDVVKDEIERVAQGVFWEYEHDEHPKTFDALCKKYGVKWTGGGE
jgi:hypothetical protein